MFEGRQYFEPCTRRGKFVKLLALQHDDRFKDNTLLDSRHADSLNVSNECKLSRNIYSLFQFLNALSLNVILESNNMF